MYEYRLTSFGQRHEFDSYEEARAAAIAEDGGVDKVDEWGRGWKFESFTIWTGAVRWVASYGPQWLGAR